ncbi:carotenoid 1,2-hydratase [Roseibium sp. RKSG952]|nr:carotenoid 1,2-hydratase [Roseibium sp. RKSG952]
MIAFVGSVFSPYYAWSGRQNPDNHVCINVALYAPEGNRWAMTERGAPALSRDRTGFFVGPSGLQWEEGVLTLDLNERAVPRPPAEWSMQRLKARVRVRPKAITAQTYDIDGQGDHIWWPIAPLAEIEVTFEGDRPDWRGHGYLDSNWGREPLERGFHYWDWARGVLPDGRAALIYDVHRRDKTRHCLMLTADAQGEVEAHETPGKSRLRRGFWGMMRHGHHDPGTEPQLIATLEDSPFYTRSKLQTRLFGQPLELMHESLSGDRYASPLVKLMLPWRMPRRTGNHRPPFA